jgi:N12 class adenine-specific DNA methylase/SAM-dependent methyltransferase
VRPLAPTAAERTDPPAIAPGEKGKARDILDAIKTLKRIETDTPASEADRAALARFPGFGAVALGLFPNPATGVYKDAGWQRLGDELRSLLTPEEYAFAKRTTFTAFYTSPTVIRAVYAAVERLGVPPAARVLEPGCGTGNFLSYAPADTRFVGVELDAISGRIAKARHPTHDIRVEDFADSRLPEFDAVVGNVPFADLTLDWRGQKFALHDFFLAKSVDSLAPGGVLAVVTSHHTLDKRNAAAREHLAASCDFLGAIRLPSDAFKREGTSVVADLLFLRKRAPGQAPNHADPAWLTAAPMDIGGTTVSINQYFHDHPEMVFGKWSGADTLYPGGYSLTPTGDLGAQLRDAIGRLPSAEQPRRVTAEPYAPPAAPRFVPPPPEGHVTEGSYFAHEGRVHQMIDGKAVPVEYGGSDLWVNAGVVGRRLGKLIALRDKARRVLQSQNEGWPEDHRQAARRDLNWAYDVFVQTYGPVNKTTFSETRDGGTVRRTPNLVKFRDDPDAMLVMALEEYDEETGEATKAPILLKDVVGKTPPVTSVESAEEGLLVSLDHKGGVDLPYIAKLYGKAEETVVRELGELIFFDPQAKEWQTADQYLSGNVRAKLKAAEAAGVRRNVEALAAVQPEDVLPGDIDANLGAPWLPVSDIRAFAAELFRVPPESVPVGHLEKDAVWGVTPDYAALNSVAATADYGTPRANGTWLLELALNLKTPVIYDQIDRETRVVNAEATLAAKEKQRQIKDQFRAWVFADPDRTERLVRLYNDAFNNLRPRLFDGSHLAFPGMSRAFTPRQHQRDAVWRVMSGGNTLLAHAVGAGKTAVMCTAAVKMRQAGLIHKPMIVCPNHMLEQFAREFQQLYPNAHLLVASKDDFARDRRKHLTAKVATGDWDAVIVTHSSFERIGMSREFQERFLREQIAEYDRLLVEKAGANARNIIKTIEKQKAQFEAKLKDLLAGDKKDDGLVFDELGVDQVFIDESQQFKNLALPTKMERVAGVQTGGSERAFDLFMKTRYLHGKHPGRGVVFASGTPISNTMVELYTQQRYLDPDGLRARGIEHFDAWAASFGEVVEAMEISPDGKTLKPRSRFAKFINLPELQQMFRSFADVQTADMLDLPKPRLAGGKPHVVACPMSDEQTAIQEALVKRYERIRSERVDPREDNALAITTDGRKLALDARLLSGTEDFPGSKVNALVETVFGIWERTTPTRGTQLVFCDMGVHPNPFSAYDEITKKLIERGVPPEQVAAIGDADSDAKKQALFERVRNGAVRVLIGSTAKMGTGTNVQRRLVALHHLDAPWKPAEVEQRDGRILRQGNTNPEVSVYRYVTEGSFDAYMWQALETKAKFIDQIMTGQVGVRRADDVGEQTLSYAEVKAIASGNPAVLTLAEAEAELQRLAVLKRNHTDEQYLARKNLRELPEVIARQEQRLSSLEADARTVAGNDPHVSQESLTKALTRVPPDMGHTRRYPLGSYRGLAFGVELHPGGAADVYLEGEANRNTMLSRESRGARSGPERPRPPRGGLPGALRPGPAGTRGQPVAIERLTGGGWTGPSPTPRMRRSCPTFGTSSGSPCRTTRPKGRPPPTWPNGSRPFAPGPPSRRPLGRSPGSRRRRSRGRSNPRRKPFPGRNRSRRGLRSASGSRPVRRRNRCSDPSAKG